MVASLLIKIPGYFSNRELDKKKANYFRRSPIYTVADSLWYQCWCQKICMKKQDHVSKMDPRGNMAEISFCVSHVRKNFLPRLCNSIIHMKKDRFLFWEQRHLAIKGDDCFSFCLASYFFACGNCGEEEWYWKFERVILRFIFVVIITFEMTTSTTMNIEFLNIVYRSLLLISLKYWFYANNFFSFSVESDYISYSVGNRNRLFIACIVQRQHPVKIKLM